MRKNEAREIRGRARIRAELVQAKRDLHALGMASSAEFEKTTLRMLGRDALPKVAPLSAPEIVRVRERAGVSQAVLAGYLNVTVSTLSQWERGARRPGGAALKLLHVLRSKGLAVLR